MRVMSFHACACKGLRLEHSPSKRSQTPHPHSRLNLSPRDAQFQGPCSGSEPQGPVGRETCRPRKQDGWGWCHARRGGLSPPGAGQFQASGHANLSHPLTPGDFLIMAGSGRCGVGQRQACLGGASGRGVAPLRSHLWLPLMVWAREIMDEPFPGRSHNPPGAHGGEDALLPKVPPSAWGLPTVSSTMACSPSWTQLGESRLRVGRGRLKRAGHARPACPVPSAHEGSWNGEEALAGTHGDVDRGLLPPHCCLPAPMSSAQLLAGTHRHGDTWHCQGPH